MSFQHAGVFAHAWEQEYGSSSWDRGGKLPGRGSSWGGCCKTRGCSWGGCGKGFTLAEWF